MAPLPDVRPIITQSEAGSVSESDSTGSSATLVGGTLVQTPGSAITTGGTVTVDYGTDGPGAIVPNGTVTISGESAASNALRSNGVDVTIVQSADGYYGLLDGTSTHVFDFSINPATGVYTYTQHLPLSHSNSTLVDEPILIQFGFAAIDGDGDQTPGVVDITVTDSGLVLTADSFTFTGTTPVAIDLLDNDTLGMDGLAGVSRVTIGGTDYHITTNPTTITLPQGVLVLNMDGTGTFTSATGAGDVNLTYVVTDGDGDTVFDSVNAEISCFALGTLIATPCGEVPVETLQFGDLILTADGATTAVRWLGHQTVHRLFSGPQHQPVRICAGALGNGLPHSDLTVTADHGMIIDGLVINAAALVNGGSIDFVKLDDLPDHSTYYHIETDNHAAILANGAAAETFVDAAGRAGFDNYQEYLDLYGVERIIPAMAHPRISAQRLVPDAIKKRLGMDETKTGDLAPAFASGAGA